MVTSLFEEDYEDEEENDLLFKKVYQKINIENDDEDNHSSDESKKNSINVIENNSVFER